LPSVFLPFAQEDANMLLDAYREVYFTGGVSSVYLWEEEEEAAAGGAGGAPAGSFAGCFLILKRVGGAGGEEGVQGPVGTWESSHVVQVKNKTNPAEATYKVNTTVSLS
ncbi:unnamed protein product, partial [Hapterophycus canaliculatus]